MTPKRTEKNSETIFILEIFLVYVIGYGTGMYALKGVTDATGDLPV
jgi:hypothetical protein